MKKIAYLFITALLMSMPLFAQAPQTINYQGYLEDAGGPVNGATDLSFTIWDANTLGNQEWGPENLSPTITDGVFNVTLGQSTPINLNWDEEYWLQIVVDPLGANQTLPRVRIASGGYSLTTQRIEATDAAGQSAITAINTATSGTINTARLNTGVVLDTENPNAAGDISGDYSNGLTIDANSVGADELNVSGNGTAGEILSSDGDGSFSWVADQTGGGGSVVAVKAYKTSSQTINAGDTDQILFQSEEYDTGNDFASNQFTAPENGYYQVSSLIGIGTTSNTALEVQIRVDGITIANDWRVANSNFEFKNIISTLVYMNQNEVLTFYGSAFSGGGNVTLGSGQYTTFITIIKVG